MNEKKYNRLNNPFTSKQAWSMVICACIFYCFQFLLRVSPSVLTEQLKISFSVNSCELGFLSACYYNAYALMQIPIGILLDRFNVRNIISVSCAIATLGTVIFALSNSLFIAGIGRFMMGMGAACGFIGTLKIITLCIDKRHTVRAVAIAMVFGTCGGTLGSAPLAMLSNFLTWRHTLLLIAVVGVLLTGLLYILLKPLNRLDYTLTAKVDFSSISNQFSKLAKMNQFWLLSLFGMLMYVPLSAFADLWGPSFLALKLNVNSVHAATISSVIYLGVCIGAPIASFFSERFRSYRIPMIVSSILMTLFFHFIIYVTPLTACSMSTLLILSGIAFGGQCLVFSALNEKVIPASYGFASGFMNMLIMMSGVIFEPLIGSLLDQNSTVDLLSYENALQPILVALVIAIGISFMIRVKYPTHS